MLYSQVQSIYGLLAVFAIADCATVKDLWLVPGSDSAHEHNRKRVLHQNTPILKSNWLLALSARRCVQKMIEGDLEAKYHPCNPLKESQGENIYEGKSELSPDKSLIAAIEPWYDELKGINFTDPKWSVTLENKMKEVGHVTQLLWSSTERVGCAGGNFLKGNEFKKYIVCRYQPPGNSFYATKLLNNVHPLKTKCADKNEILCGMLYKEPKDTTYYCNGAFKETLSKNCPKTCGRC